MVKTITRSILVVLMGFSTGMLFAQNATYKVTVNTVPGDIASFEAFRDSLATTPEGGAIVMLFALRLYQQNRTEGTKALIVAVDSNRLSKSTGPDSYKGFALDNSTKFLLGQIEKYPYMLNSYLPGATRANGYTPSAPPYIFTLTSNQYSGSVESGQIKLFLPSSGADTPRPITLKRNSKGIWKAAEFSSLLTGVAPPATANPGDDL
jgi:hypothetical protein